jgi:hypothetical protein
VGCIGESGWTVHASVEQKTRTDKNEVADIWCYCRLVGWVEGSSV